MAVFPAWIEGLGASKSCRISPMTKTEGGRDGGRERFSSGGVHPRPSTHSLTQTCKYQQLESKLRRNAGPPTRA